MGWPLAVTAGLMDKSPRALLSALWPLSIGHLLAMLLMLLPFTLLLALTEWQRQIKTIAALLIIGFGLVRLVWRRHPRAQPGYRQRNLGSGRSRSRSHTAPA